MKIIDAQIHIWGQGKPSGLHRQVPVFTAEEVLAEMDAAGVDAALIHPPASWDPDSNALAIAAAARYPKRFAVMGQFPPERVENRPLIQGWRNQPGMVAHPGLKLILDHCGLVRTGQDEAAFAQLDTLLALARLPNVAVKATGAPHYSTQGYPYRNLHDGLQRIFDAFGPERFFWGTDITRMPCSYRQCVTFFTEELPWLGGRELEWVMGRGLCQWVGWDYDFG